MLMAKSDSRFEYKADLNRTDHDLSQKLGFTSASGMLLPIWFDFASPGDSYYMQHDLPLLRSVNLAAPAMVDVKVHYETFFVPMQMLLQPFENCMFSLKNLQSTNFDGRTLTNNNFPLFDYAGYISDIKNNHYSDDIHADAFRLADLFGLCPDNFVNRTSTHQEWYSPSFFPWQLLAYHTIFMYYFRLDDKSQFSASTCNWDSSFGSSTPVGALETDMMMIHQRPWNFDYFTSIYRSPIISDANMQSLRGNMIVGFNNLFSGATLVTKVENDGTGNASNEDTRAFGAAMNNAYQYKEMQRQLSTAVIRQMFASEKLAMITGRTRKNYDSQVLAHYGVSVPHDVKHDITMIHSDVYQMNVQEVTSLANTGSSGSPLGELAGKGYSAGNGKQFKFSAPCHGVIMTIFSVEPQKRYISAFDKINQVTNAFDFPTPEFDRLGNVPMFRYECGFNIGQTGFSNTDIVGWKERYYANKRKYDKSTYAFATGTGIGFNNYASFMLCERPFGLEIDNTQYLSSGIDQRPDLENRFYIERNAVDSLCLVNYSFGWKHSETGEDWDSSPWLVYARDPFIINSFIKAKKVSWMSKDGEPVYNW